MSTDTNTQPTEDTKDLETVTEQTEETAQESEETLGDTLGNVEEKTPKREKPKTVPMDTFLELKKELKELKSIKNSSSNNDLSLDDVTNSYPDVDPEFIKKLANSIKNSTVKEFEEKYSTKISELEKVSKREEQNKKFDAIYEKAIDQMPYFKGIANKEVLKQLAFNPANANKTFSQIMEETYGGAVQGKRTMETAQPNGGRADETVNFAEAGNPAVYARIKADPKLHAQYREYVLKNLNI